MEKTPKKKSISVLAVDDEVLGLFALKDVILQTGVADVCAEASSVSEAISEAKQTKPNCLVLDYHLADGNAMEIVTALQSEDRTIIISADSSKKEKLTRLGIPFLHKPVNSRELKSLFLSISETLTQ